MKPAIEVMRNKEMGSYKASRIFQGTTNNTIALCYRLTETVQWSNKNKTG